MVYCVCPKCFRSIAKYGRRQQSFLIFTIIASLPKPLEECCRNLPYEFLSMSRCVRPKNDSGPSTNMAERQPSLKSLIALYLTLLSHLLRDHSSEMFPLWSSCVRLKKRFRSVGKYGRCRPSLLFAAIASPPKLLRNCFVEILDMNSSQHPDVFA